jgi:DNA-binding FrmR family transcriptional regulator
MKTNEQLINNIVGQLNGVKRMIAGDDDCFRIITQFKAARASLNALMIKFMQENLNACMKNSSNKEEFLKMERLIAEITKNQ